LISKAIGEGRQVYWVCTLIEESESLQAEAAEDAVETLREMLPERKIGLVHGRLKPRDKEAAWSVAAASVARSSWSRYGTKYVYFVISGASVTECSRAN